MISTLKFKLVLGLLIGMAILLGIFVYQNQGLRGDNKLLNTQLTEANGKLKAQQAVITELETMAKQHAQAQQTLLSRLSTTKHLLTKHEQTIRILEQENETLKIWSNTRLPDPVIRLRQRPAITGSEAYQNWLSERDALPIAGSKPANQR